MTKIKRKITKINDSAADAAGADEATDMLNSKTAAVPAAVPAAAEPVALVVAKSKGKSANISVPLSPGSNSSGSPERAPAVPSAPVQWEPVPHTQSFTGMGKKQNRKPKVKSDESEQVTMMKKRWTKRPEHWRTIAEYYKNNTLEATLIEYQDDLGDFSTVAQYHKLHSWKKELENDIDVRIQPPGREPAYGNEIDLKLMENVLELLIQGHPVDDATLRNELVKILAEEGRSDLLIENGGTCVFQTSWAARFWKRHEASLKDLRAKNISVAQAQISEMKEMAKKEKGKRRVEPTPADVDDSKKPWTRRPDNWTQMAEYFAEHGITNTLSTFKDDLGHLNYSAAYQKLNNWRNDMISQRELHAPGRPPNYGELIDNQLLAIVQDRIKTGQNVDDFVMREILVDLLTAVGKETMLRENGGECTFGHSWAVRFRKRHNLPTRDQNGRKRKIRMLEGDGEDEDDILAAHVGLNGNSSSTTTSAAAAMSSSEADLAMDATANASLPTATEIAAHVNQESDSEDETATEFVHRMNNA
mmetsp:Transcript_102380/g.200754  ORF Transcript_102380/g.200754 Transcript_102380/m.200754 type:complete len:531 (+) Transcript_102380:88-1680(+)